MADRVVNGNTNTENGWRLVDTGSCVWVKVPGTNVSLQIREGQPQKIMGAFAADFNAYVEPLRDADSACYTESNPVLGTPGRNNGSNHMSATAMDLNWGTHPFRVANAGFNGAQIATIREMLASYEDTIFWGNDWDNPKDSMHFQMGYDTYGSENVGRVQDFINRKIRSDGFSTFRRGGTVPPPPPPQLSRADRYALLIIAEGRKRGITPRGIQIALATGLVESNLTIYANAKVPASMTIPHDAVGSDGYSVGIFQQQVRDTGNGWWWGDAATCMDPTSSAGLFYDRLARLDYNGPNSPGSYAQAVQSSAFPGRYDQRFGEAVALYNRLAGTAPPPPQPPPPVEGFLMALSDQEQRNLYNAIMNPRRSRSPLRQLDEGNVGDAPDQIWDMDASIHILVVYLMAMLGNPSQLALLNQIAGADPARYPDRQADRPVAQAILAEVDDNSELKQNILSALSRVTTASQPLRVPMDYDAQSGMYVATAPPVQTFPAVVPALPASVNGNGAPPSTGQIIGDLYAAIEQLNLADALDIKDRATLAATIKILETKNGSQL